MFENRRELSVFLATNLASFMAINRLNNQKWTKSRVADYITGHSDISGSISDTTIGRFLDPAYPQEPSVSTLRMVTEFLLVHKCISKKQLNLLEHDKETQIAATLSDFFKAGQTASDTDLLEKLEGSYSNYTLSAPYLLETQLILTRHKAEKLLTAYETMRLFKVNDDAQLKIFTENRSPQKQGLMQDALKSLKAEVLAQHALSGAGVATSGLITLLMKPPTTGFSAVVSVDVVNMTDEDDICGLRGSRNRGWDILAPGETLPLFENISKLSPHRVMKTLSGKIDYYPQLIPDIQKMRVAKETEEDDSGTMKFHGSVSSLPGQNQRNKHFMDNIEKIIGNAENANEKLKLSIEWGSLGHFERALEEGANADLKLEDSNLPLIFYLASLGQYEWVKILVEVGNCDLTYKDERGLPASHIPGVYAKVWAQAIYANDIRQGYVETARYLREQEIKQSLEKNLTHLSNDP